MPLFAPIHSNEKDTLVAQLEHSIQNARDVFFELDIDQLRAKPIASSELTLGWLLLHMGEVVDGWGKRAASGPVDPFAGMTAAEEMQQGETATAIGDDETAADLLRRFDEYTAAGVTAFASADLDSEVAVPNAPWFPEDMETFNARWTFHHVLEELHRHSGHADILREAVDGAQMYELRGRAEGFDMSYIEKWFEAHADELYA